MRLGSLGPTELILIVLVLVLIFGASKIGDIGGALGKSVKEFKKATKEDEDAAAVASRTDVTPPPTSSIPSAPPAPAKPVEYRPTDVSPNS